jgi:hypothetical protein
MPDPTDFVTDLPADFEIFGDAVDATVDGIETKLDVITTEGDLVVGDASGNPVRLPIGALGTVLTSDGDTAEWAAPTAGGYTQLTTGALSGSTVSITSINSGYKELILFINNPKCITSSNNFRVRFNNISTSTYAATGMNTSSLSLNQSSTQSGFIGAGFDFEATTLANTRVLMVHLPNYSVTNVQKFWTATHARGHRGFTIGTNTTPITAVIDRIDIVVTSGANFDGGTFTLFGVN